MMDTGFKSYKFMLAGIHVEENGSAAMLASKSLAGVTPQVNIKEHVTHSHLPSVNEAALV